MPGGLPRCAQRAGGEGQQQTFHGLVHDLVFLLERNREVFPLLTSVRGVPLGLEEAHHGRN